MGDGGDGRLFMTADGDLFPVVMRTARRSTGGTLTARFDVGGELEDLGLGGGGAGVPRAQLSALAELLQGGGEWLGGSGRRNRTFRYRLVGPDGAGGAGGAGGAAGAGAEGGIDPAHLLGLASSLMPTQHRLLGRGTAGGGAAAALAASNTLPLSVVQPRAGRGAGHGGHRHAGWVGCPNAPAAEMLAALQNVIGAHLMAAAGGGGAANGADGFMARGGRLAAAASWGTRGMPNFLRGGFPNMTPDDLARVLNEGPPWGGPGQAQAMRGVREEPRTGVDAAIDAPVQELTWESAAARV
ncbi:hypothetical protein HYH03_019135 [Edaphochlamys debaryana]|uniref:Uncharacterized protein n=1 Tax=Edaphochlamys debaryana TaxID=47281 RepID=A0A835XDD3_9CHLO|nr:hypothetical protein HYH03_019135 [Edaphochlamys debaryana]|eukprot:KAG2481908.1 hypothetical protein HYH03_019135 [Edaphochlamys debaryana]